MFQNILDFDLFQKSKYIKSILKIIKPSEFNSFATITEGLTV